MDDGTLYEKVIYEDMEKAFQLRLVVSEFRNQQYVHLRKYFLSYEGEWIPSKEGATFPANIDSIYNLASGLLELCSMEESKELIQKYFNNDKQTHRVPE